MGAFTIGDEQVMTRREYEEDQMWQRLHRDFGLDADRNRNPEDRVSRFGHAPLERWRPWAGRLQIMWTGGTRSWCRRAHSNVFEVEAILPESDFSEAIPPHHTLTLRAPEFAVLPTSWQAELARWRGIYLITVEGEGARYVGSAYGQENLLGRWRAHLAGTTGVTKELSLRKTQDFRFSILELLAPDAPMEDVVRRERGWMDRLHTIEYGLNT